MSESFLEPFFSTHQTLLTSQEEALPWEAVEGINKSTDKILGLLEDPKRDGKWDRRGMVVGHVQSGKTGSYTGLICKAADAGYKIIIVTNQSGIYRGYYTEHDYQKVTQWMLTQFANENINVLDTFHCPHGPDSTCNCRKPKPGMFLKAKDKHSTDMEKSWLIGDNEIDVIAANEAGIENTILVRSGHRIDESNSNARFILDTIQQSKQIITI